MLSAEPFPISGSSFVDNAQMKEALTLLKSLLSEVKWVASFEKEGVKASTCSLPGSSLLVTRGDTFVKNMDIYDIFTLYFSAQLRHLWDDRTESAQVEEYLPDRTVVASSVQKGVWPVSSRDVVAVNSPVCYDEELGAYIILQQSVGDSTKPMLKKSYPERRGYVRAHLHIAALVAKRVDAPTLSGRVGDWELTYIVQADAKGSVPSAMVSLFSQAQPMGVGHLVRFTKKHGAMPKLMDIHGIHVQLERMNPKTFDFEAEYMGPGTGRIKFDEKLFPNGAEVTMTGPGKFTRLENDTYLGLSVQGSQLVKLSVQHKKNAGPGEVFVNGVKL